MRDERPAAPPSLVVVEVQCPDSKSADVVAETLVTENLCSSVDIIQGVTKISKTEKGKFLNTEQSICIARASKDQFEDLCAKVKQMLPTASIHATEAEIERDVASDLTANTSADAPFNLDVTSQEMYSKTLPGLADAQSQKSVASMSDGNWHPIGQ